MATRITNRLPQFIAGVQKDAASAIVQALGKGASEAAAMTPIDTSTLLNSQFRHVAPEGSKIVGTVGYTAAYALPVHDPEHKQNFRRTAARKEFLKLGFERAEPVIRATIVSVLKR